MLIELFEALNKTWPPPKNKRHSIVFPIEVETLGLDIWLAEDLARFYPMQEHDFQDTVKLINSIKNVRGVDYFKTVKVGKTVSMLMELFEAINKVWPEPTHDMHSLAYCTETQSLELSIWSNEKFQFHFVIEEKQLNDVDKLINTCIENVDFISILRSR